MSDPSPVGNSVTNNFVIDYLLNPTASNSTSLKDYLLTFTDNVVSQINSVNSQFTTASTDLNTRFTNLVKNIIEFRTTNEAAFKQLKLLTNINSLIHRSVGVDVNSSQNNSLSLEILYNTLNNPTPENIKAFLDSSSGFYSNLSSDLNNIYTNVKPQTDQVLNSFKDTLESLATLNTALSPLLTGLLTLILNFGAKPNSPP